MDTSDLQPGLNPVHWCQRPFKRNKSQQSLKCLMPRKLGWKPFCTQWDTQDVVFELVNNVSVFSSWIKQYEGGFTATAYVVIWSWGYANSKAIRSLQIAEKWTLLQSILSHPATSWHHPATSWHILPHPGGRYLRYLGVRCFVMSKIHGWCLHLCTYLRRSSPLGVNLPVLWIIWDDFINQRTVSTRINQGCESSGTNTYFSPTFGKGNNILSSLLGMDMSR